MRQCVAVLVAFLVIEISNSNNFCWEVNAMAIENFRSVAATSRIFRCAKTEPLADVTQPSSDPEKILLMETGLIVDLRSSVERNESQARDWMSRFAFEATDGTDTEEGEEDVSSSRKTVLRLDVQPRDKVIRYLDDTWLTPSEKAISKMYKIFDVDRLHSLRMDVLNERGLAGLNEAILEVGGLDLCIVLRKMTRHLEMHETGVAFHCVQGKDRTGVLAMLLQSILGSSDEDILEEYHRSDSAMRDPKVALTNDNRILEKGKFCRNRFAGAPKQAMEETLAFLRQKYGSVSPGYLDSIGFDASWRKRFLRTQQGEVATDPTFVAQ